jgi:2,3-bisphosphoglycerate-independent phosphoglycerate mutase
MKAVMVIIDGLGDEAITELSGDTPLAAAFAPNLHYIASRGQVGRIETTFPSFPIESMVCIMGLLGYEPEKYYPTGRASFEALAKGIPLNANDLVFRCNTITIDRNKQTLADFTGGLISNSDARKLIGQINLPYDHWELYPGQSYRNILILRRTNVRARHVRCFEPHMNIGGKINDLLVQAVDASARGMVEEINRFLIDTQQQIDAMKLGESCAANMLWVWSPSEKPIWPSFKERTGLNAAVVGGLDFLHGIAMAAKIHFDVIPGATGYIDTDYSAKAAYAIKYLTDFDFILVHINAADEEAHQHNHAGKIKAIEQTDRLVVGPLLHKLHEMHAEDFRIVICGDHTTRCSDGKHTNDFVPYAIYGKGLEASGVRQFSEATCGGMAITRSLEFLKNIVYGQV